MQAGGAAASVMAADPAARRAKWSLRAPEMPECRHDAPL
jgi:hypothetical protein